jgi:cobalamin biosynthesis protein CobT
MNLADLTARVRRLDELGRGLAKEVTLWKACNDPLFYLERRAYLKAIQDALAGVEEARVTLVQAQRRLEKKKGE